jgi:hypothetical protein
MVYDHDHEKYSVCDVAIGIPFVGSPLKVYVI